MAAFAFFWEAPSDGLFFIGLLTPSPVFLASLELVECPIHELLIGDITSLFIEVFFLSNIIDEGEILACLIPLEEIDQQVLGFLATGLKLLGKSDDIFVEGFDVGIERPHSLIKAGHLGANRVDRCPGVNVRNHDDHLQEEWTGTGLRQLKRMLLASETDLAFGGLGEGTHDAKVQHE